MEWLSFEGVNWLAVLIAFVVTFVISWVWYSDRGFFPVWKKAQGITSEQMEGAPMGVSFGGAILGNLLGIVLLAVLMAGLGVTGWWQGLLFGAVVGLVYRAGAHAIHNGFALRKPLITLIDGAADTVGLAVAGLILGLMA